MNQKVIIGNSKRNVTLTQSNYLGAGGEAQVFANGGQVYKLYHEPATKMLPSKKMQELSVIHNPNVITPQEIIYNTQGNALGYTTELISPADPLLKYFTRTFKDTNGIDPAMINHLIKQMQLTVIDIHKNHILVVDLNELNILVKNQAALEPYFIDTDSYCTPSFPATAVMDSIRDRRVSKVDSNGKLHYNPDVMSDWFSFAILAFWTYSNIHPFRGSHPSYRPKDKCKQMDDGISIFHPSVRVPPTVNDFNIIPKRHLAWFKDIFLNNNRSIPPLPDGAGLITVPAAIIVKSTGQIEVIEKGSFTGTVLNVMQLMGVNYVATRSKVYAGKNEVMDLDQKVKKVLFCVASDSTPLMAIQSRGIIEILETNSNKFVDKIAANEMFARNGAIYTMGNGKLFEHTFPVLGTKILRQMKAVDNISTYSAKAYDGCVIQNLLGKYYLTLPYKKGYCFSKYIPNLDGFRVVDAKSDKTISVIIAEKGGKYTRFIIGFTKDFANFEVREVSDIAYDTINFAVMDNGLCLLLANSNELEMFVDSEHIQTLQNPPFDSTMQLFATPEGFFFINNNSIHQIKKK